jgi:hypothetical protein
MFRKRDLPFSALRLGEPSCVAQQAPLPVTTAGTVRNKSRASNQGDQAST